MALVTKEISTESVTDNPHLETLKIVLPVAGGTILILIIILAVVLRRRRLGHTRTPKAESPVSWLQKHDRVMLLDNMTVISKNPSYYTAHDETFLSNVREKLIPKDSIQLMEEIGEGAFGKVFKGE